MVVKKYKSKVITVRNHFEDLITVEFASLGREFKYYPGQFLHLALDQNYDGTGQWPESRCFSMQSSPGNETIVITFAVKGLFTELMRTQLKPGVEVWLKLPYGDLFTQQHAKTNTVFIAGGTGITPFLSLFNHHSFSEYLNSKIYLGFRSKKHNIYEIKRPDNSKHSIEIFYRDTQGVIDIEYILGNNDLHSHYFISGPPFMIKDFKQKLTCKGVPKNNIFTDDWE